MQNWKILLLGITGDLAKLKVLPAISQFSENNQSEVQIDLIGYSRTVPDTKQIERILDDSSSLGKHTLSSINYFQGQYNNAAFFDSLYNATSENEKLVIFMAVPPNVFLEFLQNSCPHNDKNIEIILEKPFGRDAQEAETILKTIHSCKLTNKVHFFDHYLYKSEMQLSRAEISNLKSLKNKVIKEINLQALETVGVGTRGQYYDGIGATKDMLPHLFSMLCLNLEILDNNFDLNYFEDLQIEQLLLGQYKNYASEMEKATNTETYFLVKTLISNMKVTLESGKKLDTKLTQITTIFTDESKLIWNIAPNKTLTYISDTDNFSLNLDKDKNLDHTNMFENLLDKTETNFVTPGQVLTSWWLFNKVDYFKKLKRIPLNLYPNTDNNSINSKIDITQNSSDEIEQLQKSKQTFEQSLDNLLNQDFILSSSNQTGKIQL
jgi:glucose-6-phosphate 1-dehydrogenase